MLNTAGLKPGLSSAMTTPAAYSDPVRAAEAIVEKVGRRIVLAVPVGIGKPNLLLNALFQLAEADRSIKLRILSGLGLVRPRYKSELERRFVGPLIDRLFGSWPDIAYIEAMRAGQLPENVEVQEFFLQAAQWLGNPGMQQSFASLAYSHVSAHLVREGVNVLAQLVAPQVSGARDHASLSSNPDVALDLRPYVEARRAAGEPIVLAGEFNDNLPYMPGAAEIRLAELDVVLEPPQPHFALFAPPKEAVSISDHAMALHASTMIKDGGTLQIGIGSFADAFCHALILRHTRNAEYRDLIDKLGTPLPEGAELGPFEAGLYGCSEMLVDGFLALRRAGVLARRVVDADGGKALIHAGFFVGSSAFYDELKALPAEALDEIVMCPISFTNTLEGDFAAKVAQRRHARFVNTALVLTLLGAASSDALEDGRVISGIGGQGDFVLQAFGLPEARSIIAARATRAGSGDKITSNILWRYANTSIPRQVRDVYVTEYGIADVRGRSDREVVQAMLAIADSRFQPRLQREATASGKLPKGFTLPQHAKNNVPAAIEGALGPAQSQGLLPTFPFGSEMTRTEQVLLPALGALKGASPLQLAHLFWLGLRAQRRDAPDPQVAGALARLALATPNTWREHAMAALVAGALLRE
jgi:acyl-CoA hydrolase